MTSRSLSPLHYSPGKMMKFAVFLSLFLVGCTAAASGNFTAACQSDFNTLMANVGYVNANNTFTAACTEQENLACAAGSCVVKCTLTSVYEDACKAAGVDGAVCSIQTVKTTSSLAVDITTPVCAPKSCRNSADVLVYAHIAAEACSYRNPGASTCVVTLSCGLSLLVIGLIVGGVMLFLGALTAGVFILRRCRLRNAQLRNAQLQLASQGY